MATTQEKFWTSKFGKDYLKRNIHDPKFLDKFYKKQFGVTATEINKKFLGNLKINNILEVGCNVGNKLRMLQTQGYKNLYGIEIFPHAVEEAKKLTKNINIIQGSAFDIPFKDNYFDMVFTSGLLIHISPNDIQKAIREIYRVSKKYIWGHEYHSNEYEEIKYRNNNNSLWKTNFAQLYLDAFPDLKLVKEEKYRYSNDNHNVDTIYLLKKI